jgi:hypothetical protein
MAKLAIRFVMTARALEAYAEALSGKLSENEITLEPRLG